ncbi:heavy metal translocating P-type ATPase [Legionella worsleiensis]|uniref:Cation transporting ATPase PacS n=1 Tax=Legionella worsleiensis TaxID=45076 RepID=A0A0W1AF92_9GAMM|nr:cation-translocating P-type ATPase [Legionella worsleiensis]KTD79995.1 cation transporting ATPase PacS [Legionella worsleiensis]STY32467.1 cation transporting ATPase PacS [Legionella worsleiensis]
MPKPYIFYVSGMTCTSCSSTLESYLKAMDLGEIETFDVKVTEPDPKKLTITFTNEEDLSAEQHLKKWNSIKGYIEDLKYTCEDAQYAETISAKTIASQFEQRKKILKSHWLLGALGCISGIALLALSLTMGGLPLIAMIPIACLSSALTVLLGARSYYEAWKKLITLQSPTMDTLFAISTISVMIVSVAAFFVPWLPMMFEAGLLIYGFRHIGIAIEETIKEKISSSRFQDRAPKSVRLALSEDAQETDLLQIKAGDRIIIMPGEIIPLDGECENESSIYTTIITGAILPQHARKGQKVLAGMRLAENTSPLTICVSRPAAQSYLARLDEGIEQSIHEKAPLEIKTGQLLSYFVPMVITLAISSGIILGLFFPPAIAIQCAISVLVSACPCTLGLIIPLAVKTGIHKAAEHGVTFKNSKVLQEAEQIDTIVFDLNGTLTEGVPAVKHYAVLDNAPVTCDDFLALCSALEDDSSHPVGKSIHAFCNKHPIKKLTATKSLSPHHSGIQGSINDKHYLIGSPALMNEMGISTAHLEKTLKLEAGDSLVLLAQDKKLLGYIIITDPLRKDSYKTIKTLTEMGKTVHLCTGADHHTAARYAKALGITHIHANALARSLVDGDKSKPAYLKILQRKGHKVAMVGDAANDAPAIAASDLGIAVLSQDSDELTQQHAGAVIQKNTLLPIINTFSVSQQTVSNIRENLLFSLIYNTAAILLAGGLLVAVGITLNPAVGVALMAIQASLIMFNVYRFKKQPLQQPQDIEQIKEQSGTANQTLHPKTLEHQAKTANKHQKTVARAHPNPDPHHSSYLWNICSRAAAKADKPSRCTEEKASQVSNRT